MRKLFAVFVLVGGILAGAGLAMAQPTAPSGQIGIGDPLTLAASGVLIPYQTSSGLAALIEVASPVASNPDLHMLFYNNTCARTGASAFVPLTTNDIAFVDPVAGGFVTVGTSGLVAIAGSFNGTTLLPLAPGAALHSRVYQFNSADGRSRVYEPIIIDTAEYGFPGTPQHIWSPLRTAATFYAPAQTTTILTQLTLICPRVSIQGAAGAPFGVGFGPLSTTDLGAPQGFPVIVPGFKNAPSVAPAVPDMGGILYDTAEVPITDIGFTCDCLTADVPVLNLSPLYAGAAAQANGTYTEIQVTPGLSPGPTSVGTASSAAQLAQRGSFTGYRAVFSAGNPLNNFWGRLSNGNQGSIMSGGGAPILVPPTPPVDGTLCTSATNCR